MAVYTSESKSVRALRSNLSGAVLLPGEPGYDRARRVWNAMIDRRPALIVVTKTLQDVAAAILFAREHGLPLSVKGGGHGVAGKAVCDGGVTIDLARMRSVTVDPERRIARVGGGATLGDLDTASQAHGLATTAGVYPGTGVAGLTLGGGIGFLMRRFGLSCDNLLAAEVVTADGEVITASDEQHPDLIWALRGGGGNFGVVTEFVFRLHPLTTVLGGLLSYPITEAPRVLRAFRALTDAAPDELQLYANLVHPPDGAPVMIVVVCYCGPPAEYDAIRAKLRALGPPAADTVAPIPYLTMQNTFVDAFPEGWLHYWKSSFLDRLDDAVIDLVAERFGEGPGGGLSINMEHLGGAIARVAPDATAFADRDAAFTYLVVGSWHDPAETAAKIAWVRGTWEAAAARHLTRASAYANYLDTGDENRAAAVYGPNYARLAAIKAAYDPANLFRSNINIPPIPPAST